MYYFIEPMIEADIERVQAIERQSFVTPWSANTYRSELRNPSNSRYVVARASPAPPPAQRADQPRRRGVFAEMISVLLGTPTAPPINPHPIVGYGGLWLAIDEGHVTTLAVEPEYRGRGIGELLLNGLTDQAMQLNAEILTLEVRISNVVAQQLYLKYGFRPFGTRPHYYTDNNEDALIMSTDSIRLPAYQDRLRQLRAQLFERLRHEAAEPPPSAGRSRPNTRIVEQPK